MRRDNFPAPVIKALRERVAHRCSNLDHRVSTIGPGDKPLAVANIGKAAHITAAAPGGPRYDASLTQEQRRSIENAIWLCSNCATMIDVDPDTYPTALLLDWKRIAEATAHSEKGKRQAHPDDALNQLTAALTGAPMKLKQTAIHNTHAATEQALSALDPRLRVETGYSKGATTYTIHAREPVNFQVRVPARLAPVWMAALRDIFDHGREARLPAAGVKLTGSPLLEQMLAGHELATATIGPADGPKASALKLRVIDPATGQAEQFDDLPSAFRHGAKSLSFDGAACGGALKVSLTMDRRAPADKPAFTICVDPAVWQGVDIRRLPHFEKLRRLIARLRAGWLAHIEVEVEGLPVAALRGAMPNGGEQLAAIEGFFEYVAQAIRAAERFGALVRFESDRPISEEDFARIAQVIETIEETALRGKSALAANPTTNLLASEDHANIQDVVRDGLPHEVLWVEKAGEKLLIFGQPIALPRRVVRLDGVRAIVSSSAMAVKAGEEFSVEWEPLDTFSLTRRYLKDGESFDREPEPATD